MSEQSPPIVIDELARLAAEPDALAWQPFRAGIEIHRLYGGSEAGPSAALLRYAPGASVPEHTHQGYEHIFVLAGAQQDARGRYGAGSFVVNPPGSHHAVQSPEGCIVLVIWQAPISWHE